MITARRCEDPVEVDPATVVSKELQGGAGITLAHMASSWLPCGPPTPHSSRTQHTLQIQEGRQKGRLCHGKVPEGWRVNRLKKNNYNNNYNNELDNGPSFKQIT